MIVHCIDKYPGIFFLKTTINSSSSINSHGGKIDCLEDIGISISIPEKSMRPEEKPLELVIHPCFSGPFELPGDYISASPVFLIHLSRKVKFLKDVTVKIHHHANLQTEEDCEDMVFLSASSTPEYRGSHPVYTFKKIRGAKTVFKPGDQVGEISLRHFCMATVGKRKRGEDNTPQKHKSMN